MVQELGLERASGELSSTVFFHFFAFRCSFYAHCEDVVSRDDEGGPAGADDVRDGRVRGSEDVGAAGLVGGPVAELRSVVDVQAVVGSDEDLSGRAHVEAVDEGSSDGVDNSGPVSLLDAALVVVDAFARRKHHAVLGLRLLDARDLVGDVGELEFSALRESARFEGC